MRYRPFESGDIGCAESLLALALDQMYPSGVLIYLCLL